MSDDSMARWRAERPESAARFDALEARFKADARRETRATLAGGLVGLLLTVPLCLLVPSTDPMVDVVAGAGIGTVSVLGCVLLAQFVSDWWQRT